MPSGLDPVARPSTAAGFVASSDSIAPDANAASSPGAAITTSMSVPSLLGPLLGLLLGGCQVARSAPARPQRSASPFSRRDHRARAPDAQHPEGVVDHQDVRAATDLERTDGLVPEHRGRGGRRADVLVVDDAFRVLGIRRAGAVVAP